MFSGAAALLCTDPATFKMVIVHLDPATNVAACVYALFFCKFCGAFAPQHVSAASGSTPLDNFHRFACKTELSPKEIFKLIDSNNDDAVNAVAYGGLR